MTTPERRLWYALRAKRLEGAKFRRQVVVDRYIADFACRLPCMLIVEVDGETHADRQRYDAARTAFLEDRGYQVLRFTNDDVMSNLDGVLTAIARALTSPLPFRGEAGRGEVGEESRVRPLSPPAAST